MRIFFTTPYSGKQYYQSYIDEVLAVLQKSGAQITTPEDPQQYQQALEKYKSRGMQPTRAHYAFITNGIAEADIVIMEASQQSLRVGHEITLSLLYGKPTLVLSLTKNHADYISHELLTGVKYESKAELRRSVRQFIKDARLNLAPRPIDTQQTLEAGADSMRLTTFATMRQYALQDEGEFGNFADLAEHDPEKAHQRVKQVLGSLPVKQPWSVSATIYNEDTPDFIFTGAVAFILRAFKKHGIHEGDRVVDLFTHGATIGRHLSDAGYRNILATSPYREMLAQTYHLCADYPEIEIREATPATLGPPESVKAVVWMDYTTNLALTESELRNQLQSVLATIRPGGCFIFDVRTETGWKAYFLTEKVATFATPNFQRISVNLPDDATGLIHFDRFIRKKQNNGLWGEWSREQIVDRMWSLDEVKGIVDELDDCQLEGVYDDDFSLLRSSGDASLAYFVLKKQ